MKIKIPSNYKSKLNIRETQFAIKKIKDYFQVNLANRLNLVRVSAPLFVKADSGLNDNLSGVEKAISFNVKKVNGDIEVVHSLAKWKRYALNKYNFNVYEGIYTDMNAIRKDEDIDCIHSVFVDQWDWEKIITKEDRNNNYLEETVKIIYQSICDTEDYINSFYPQLSKKLNKDIHIIDSEELLLKYPNLTPKEREYAITKEYGSVFIKRIGNKLSNGLEHDLRSPDYDDWELNGDILVYYPILDIALELSSMGIRVDSKSLEYQLKLSNNLNRASLPYQKSILENKLPLTIGGGIGQSRLCMFFLEKAHIGEVQSSVWSDEMIEEYKKNNIFLL